MTTTRPIPSINRVAYSGLATTVVAWMAAVHVIGWIAGRVFEWRIGFEPVWFLDCTICLPRGGWVARGLPVLGGVSLWFLLALAAAGVLSIGRRIGVTPTAFRAAAATGAGAMLVFTWLALDSRYPGSLPSVFVTVLPGSVATLAFLGAAASPGSAATIARDPSPLTPASVSAAILGPISMALLGGLISLLALGAAGLAYSSAPDTRNRRTAVGGLITALLGVVLRWNLSGRYPFLGLWV